jgi:hypothetical protein
MILSPGGCVLIIFVNIADTDTLEDDILPPLLLGLKDTNPILVAATLR